MNRGSHECHGRFIGPEAVIKAAKDFGAEAISQQLLEYAEEHGIVVPALRHVMPAEIIARLVAADHPERAADDIPCEPDGPRLDAALAFGRAIRRWRHVGPGDIRSHHPLDELSEDAGQFIERPAEAPWRAGMYASTLVGRLPNGHPQTEHLRTPLYRRWQALMLMELSNGTGHIAFTDKASLSGEPKEGAPGFIRLSGWHAIRDFGRHFAALEATAWHAAYSKQALMHVETEDRPNGSFVIRGDALARLRLFEAEIAEEAFGRYATTRDHVISMIRWAAEQALEYRGRRLPRQQEGYEELVNGGVALLEADGMAYAEVEAAVGGGFLEDLFPDWMAGQIKAAMRTFRDVVLPSLQGKLPTEIPPPDETRARTFLEWLPTQGLGQVFWHFEELTELTSKHGNLADAGVHREVGGMAASLEHVCHVLGATGNGLQQKLNCLWNPVLPRIQTMTDAKLTLFDGLEVGKGGAARFPESRAVVTAAYADTGKERIARDIRLAAIVRNQILHEGIGFLGREEAIDLFMLLFTLSFLTWHVRTQ